MNKVSVAEKLFDIGAVKFGDFTLKSGRRSPVYIDLRVIISFPGFLKNVAELFWQKTKGLTFDLLCGVPYTALPIAAAISVAHDIPMVMRRKEKKDYGLRRLVEGSFEGGQFCLIIEDLITSGSSILETAAPLLEAGLKVRDAVVLRDREEGGRENLKMRGYNLHSLLSIRELIDILKRSGRVSRRDSDLVREYLENGKAL